MNPTEVVTQWIGIHPYVPHVPHALRRMRTSGGARDSRRNGWHGPFAPAGLTIEERRAIEALERVQRTIRASMTDTARRRYG